MKPLDLDQIKAAAEGAPLACAVVTKRFLAQVAEELEAARATNGSSQRSREQSETWGGN